MPINGIIQPETLLIDDGLRLRKFDGVFDFALEWYQDTELVYLVDGVKVPYTPEKLERMYRYLNSVGEQYFIEALEKDGWKPIGDVTFWQEDMPIVIGAPNYRGRGIGSRVIAALIQRGKELGYGWLGVNEIYDWNPASRRCFEKAGFCPCGRTENGTGYRLEL